MNMIQKIANPSIDDDIQLEVVKVEDTQRVLELLRKYFFPEEPMTGSIEPKEVQAVEEEFALDRIKYGYSVMAVHKETNELVGVCMAGPQRQDEAKCLFTDADTEGDTKWGKLLRFFAYIERDAEVCKRYNVNKIFYVGSTCVAAAMRGKNLGAHLYNAVSDLAKANGYELLRADCTSYYSANIKERLGWDCVSTVYYKDYVDANNQPIFNTPPPHDSCRSYAKRL